MNMFSDEFKYPFIYYYSIFFTYPPVNYFYAFKKFNIDLDTLIV